MAGHSHSLIAAIRNPATAQNNHHGPSHRENIMVCSFHFYKNLSEFSMNLRCQYNPCSQYLLRPATTHPKRSRHGLTVTVCFLQLHALIPHSRPPTSPALAQLDLRHFSLRWTLLFFGWMDEQVWNSSCRRSGSFWPPCLSLIAIGTTLGSLSHGKS